jgi:hypothetical protein
MILKVIWRSKEILLLFISYIVATGWIAYRLFRGTVEGSAQCSTIELCLWNHLVQITTSNFPDVMLPAYSMSPFYLLFFLGYMILGLYFLSNVQLSIIYVNFKLLRDE